MYQAFGYAHARGHVLGQRLAAARRDARGQGTVEYVGLILLVSLLMVGMVAAMKGFNKYWPLGGQPAYASGASV